MIVILSAAYAVESVCLEVGKLPVSFVPIANRRLYVYQVESLRIKFPERKIILTVPLKFRITSSELLWFKKNNVNIFEINNNRTVGDEIAEIISSGQLKDSNILFMQGTCLPLEYDVANDMIGYIETDLEPPLPIESYGREYDTVLPGFFSISNSKLLIESLVLEKNDIYRSLKYYSFKCKVEIIRIKKIFLISNVISYFHTRASFTTERAFNSLKIENTVLKKFSYNTNKIKSEAYWYNNIPKSIDKYIPKYYGEGKIDNNYYYSIEYLGMMPLNEIFVYGRQTVLFWQRIFSRIENFLIEARRLNKNKLNTGATKESLFINKANSRLSEFVEKTGFDDLSALEINGVMVPSLRQIVEEASEQIGLLTEVPAFIHGDLCLSNILYDSRMRCIKFIDPRGCDEDGKMMLYGSQFYDLAKLGHSIIGLYDHIIAGQYELKIESKKFTFRIFVEQDIEDIQNAFIKHSIIQGVDFSIFAKILPLLFISMLPLHADSKNRQMALLANSLRLYSDSYNKGIN